MKNILSTHNEVARTDSYTSPLLVTFYPCSTHFSTPSLLPAMQRYRKAGQMVSQSHRDCYATA
ncbi:MAG: hypothetical protein HXO22_04670 [Prevotella sp.]|nr:hypothetical protein [Prevotella sp.]MBF1585041.1 hypothetical protein [Prevotella sp.]